MCPRPNDTVSPVAQQRQQLGQGRLRSRTMTAPPADIAAIRNACVARLRAAIDDLTHCYFHKMVWSKVAEATSTQHPHADASFINIFSQVYANSQASAVRRLADNNADSGSLWRLYEDVRRNPKVLSREVAVQASADHFGEPGTWQHEAGGERADATFTRTIGSGAHADPELMVEYQQQLVAIAADVSAYVDRRIAHLDPRGPLIAHITLDEMHTALDGLAEHANRIQLMFLDSSTAYQHVTITGDWQAPLRSSLFPRTPGQTWGPSSGGSFS